MLPPNLECTCEEKTFDNIEKLERSGNRFVLNKYIENILQDLCSGDQISSAGAEEKIQNPNNKRILF